MNSQEDRSADSAVSASVSQKELRRKAEEITWKDPVVPPEAIDSMPPEEISRLIHELRVHQIELEMQNDELRIAQMKLDASQARYFDLYNLAPVGYCTLSGKGLILDANLTASTLLGMARKELIRQPIFRFILPEDRDIFYLNRRQLTLTGETSACELHMIKKNATPFWALLSISAVLNDTAEVEYRIVMTDISPLKRLEEEKHFYQDELLYLNETLEKRVVQEVHKNMEQERMLIHQSRMAAMGEMLGNIAHQWKQPLNALNLLFYNIRDAHHYNELDEKYINQVIADGNRLVQKMVTTISDFRNFFVPGKEIRNFSVADQIAQAILLTQADFETHRIAIHVDAPDDLMLSGFPNEFSHVLLNLFSNAKDAILEYHPLHPAVDVVVTVQDGQGCIAVRDTGGGIPEDILKRIFDPYFSTKKEGSGIGLFMSKMIIEDHMNGSITAKNIGGGTELRITVPLTGTDSQKLP